VIVRNFRPSTEKSEPLVRVNMCKYRRERSGRRKQAHVTTLDDILEKPLMSEYPYPKSSTTT